LSAAAVLSSAAALTAVAPFDGDSGIAADRGSHKRLTPAGEAPSMAPA
jgi:hypothetical protein